MKNTFLAFLLLMVSPFSNGGNFELFVPYVCEPHVSMTTFLMEEYNKGRTEEEVHRLINDASKRNSGYIDQSIIEITRNIAVLIYTVQPDSDDKYKMIYESAIQRCLLDKEQQSDGKVFL